MSLLKTENVVMQFGGVVAVNDLNIDIKKGELAALIGPNGAGKTTAFNVITGVYTPTSGSVLLTPDKEQKTVDITGKRPDLITGLGIARTFQIFVYLKNYPLWRMCLLPPTKMLIIIFSQQFLERLKPVEEKRKLSKSANFSWRS